MARARHEGRWTHEEATVRGRTQVNRPWILILCVVLVVGLSALGYSRYNNFQTVSYELRECSQPLTAESTWEQVQQAGCRPVDPAGSQLVVFIEREIVQPGTVEGSTFSFDKIPLHSPAPGLRAELTRPARTVVVAEPENEQIRRQMRSDSTEQNWSANIGSRGPLHYWVLVTP